MREALIISLLKPGKPPAPCDSYRPLPLINCDAKILAKVIANRLSLLMEKLVLPDQSRFIPRRSTTHNLCTLFSILHNVDPDLALAAVFLDATKAFDSVEWDYLLEDLQCMGFPPLFLSWIRLLYNFPSARVMINGHISTAFHLTRGTRQGCPLSPLLFALAIESLAAKLRQHHQDKALLCNLRQILISLYADDVTLYVRDPQNNLNPLLK